jgi:hypothetical protein
VLLSAPVFMPIEAEILAARLTRIKTLLDALERECLDSGPTRETFLKLKQELEAALRRNDSRQREFRRGWDDVNDPC